MSNVSILKGSQTDWEALEKMNDRDIDLSDIPEITADQIAQATLRVGGKVRVNIYLDIEVVNYFKAEAGSREYQTLINETLKETIRAKAITVGLKLT